VALGCATYDPRIAVAGVILNKVASERHRRLVEDGLARVGLRCLGALMRSDSIVLPERHLGLVQAAETQDLEHRLEALADLVERSLDVDTIRSLAATSIHGAPRQLQPLRPPGQRIALASDEAFSFVYPHILDGWRAAGAEIATFSPLADEAPPAGCDACWLPGGYPELHAGRIATARRFMEGLRAFAETHALHGECGGYMVLGQTLEDAAGTTHPMAGLLRVATSYAKRKLHLGYRRATLRHDCALGRSGTGLVGHEFHYASVVRDSEGAALATVRDADGTDLGDSGHRVGLTTGTFFHVVASGA
jgi:cobyrinic acid a,c-diamide synthase